MMEIQLQTRLRGANQKVSSLPASLMEREVNLSMDKPETWLGKQPVSYPDLSKTISSILTRMESSNYVSSVAQLGGPDGVLQSVSEGFEDKETKPFMEQVYRKLLSRLQEEDIQFDSLIVITVVCAGGIPFPFYGLHASKSVDTVAERHVGFAKNHGILLDLVPMTFANFNSNLIKMAVGVGAILAAKLQQRDRGLCRVDAIMFACKGTLPVSLCLDEYMNSNQAEKKPVVAIGFGTDLLQGFIPPENEADDPVWAVKLHETASLFQVLAFNTIHDTAVGNGKQALDNYINQLNAIIGSPANKSTWLDILPDMDHNWYDTVLTASSHNSEWFEQLSQIFEHLRPTKQDD